MIFESVVIATSIIAGAIASVTGFGIGSLITPVLSIAIGTKLAVATVAVPHFIATAIRFWMLRGHLDRRIFLSFGLMSAGGGLIGALLYASFATPALTLIFGCILIFAGFMGATNLSKKIRLHGLGAWIAGGFSGFLGGMVGNQGGIRSAALLGLIFQKNRL
ncbi:MAG: sulfite exporter TauE/SafE family protein [Myxococcaceae bacterium]